MFHVGISCTDRSSRIQAGLSINPNDLATEQLLAGKSKSCPKCGVRGMKIDGCDHMTCKLWAFLLNFYHDISPLMQFQVRAAAMNIAGYVLQIT